MKKIFLATNELDKNAVDMGLSELVLQENASSAVAKCVKKHFKGKRILAFCGGGNNGADALAVLRRLSGEYECLGILTSEFLNENSKIQANIARKSGVRLGYLDNFDFSMNDDICVIDGIFGSGLSRALSAEIINLINFLNSTKALKIAVDIPSGLDKRGVALPVALKCDYSVTMGALKLALFSDFAKDFVGRIITADLGLSHGVFCGERQSDFLLEMSDLSLPFRKKQNVNKGSFGHAFVAVGAMEGAGQICALSALNMGAGKVSAVGNFKKFSYEIMKKESFKGADAISLGMGQGSTELKIDEILAENCAYIVDADMFYNERILEFAKRKNAVLTPHPKEFQSLLKLAGMGDFELNEVCENKMELARKFSLEFSSTLLVKGANAIIANSGVLYINDKGSAKLAKGGSGDALSGIILGLLAQGYKPLKAAICGSLAQAKIARKYHKNDYSYTPKDMIKGIKCL